MAACSHFLSNQRVYEQALKRGGRRSLISFDQAKSEDSLRLEPFHEETPERIFLRAWATNLLNRVMSALKEEARLKGKERLFERIWPSLFEKLASPTYAEVGAELGMSESSVKVSAHRYRNRYRVLLRQEIANTVDDPAQIEEEITTLLDALVA